MKRSEVIDSINLARGILNDLSAEYAANGDTASAENTRTAVVAYTAAIVLINAITELD